MAMALRALSRLDELDRHLQRSCRCFPRMERRIDQLDGAPFGCIIDAAELNHLARFHQTPINHRPAPRVRHQLRILFARLPMAGQGILCKTGVECLKLGRVGKCMRIAHSMPRSDRIKTVSLLANNISEKKDFPAHWNRSIRIALGAESDSG